LATAAAAASASRTHFAQAGCFAGKLVPLALELANGIGERLNLVLKLLLRSRELGIALAGICVGIAAQVIPKAFHQGSSLSTGTISCACRPLSFDSSFPLASQLLRVFALRGLECDNAALELLRLPLVLALAAIPFDVLCLRTSTSLL
jgi:hypothetical protein